MLGYKIDELFNRELANQLEIRHAEMRSRLHMEAACHIRTSTLLAKAP